MHATYTQKLIQNFLPWPKKDHQKTRFAQTWQLPQLPQLPHYLVCNNDFCFTKWPSIQMMFPLPVSLDEVMLSYYARACGALVKVTEVYAQSTSVPFSVSHITRDLSIWAFKHWSINVEIKGDKHHLSAFIIRWIKDTIAPMTYCNALESFTLLLWDIIVEGGTGGGQINIHIMATGAQSWKCKSFAKTTKQPTYQSCCT